MCKQLKSLFFKLAVFVAALAAAVGLGACGGQSDMHQAKQVIQHTNRETFLSVVHKQYPGLAGSRALDNAMVHTAHLVCQKMDEGFTANDIVNVVLSNVDSIHEAKQEGFIIGAGVAAWCPQYSDDFQNLNSPTA